MILLQDTIGEHRLEVDKAASKATPGFDVMDYGQETYKFGSSTQDARHFDKYVLKVLQEDAEILSELFNSEEK